LFQGEQWLNEANVYQMGARDFDFTVGAWDQQDPAGYVDGAGLYRFEVDRPASLLDPSGLKPFDLGAPDEPTTNPSGPATRPSDPFDIGLTPDRPSPAQRARQQVTKLDKDDAAIASHVGLADELAKEFLKDMLSQCDMTLTPDQLDELSSKQHRELNEEIVEQQDIRLLTETRAEDEKTLAELLPQLDDATRSALTAKPNPPTSRPSTNP
jgi:RHS repeat-associated protein